MSVIKRTAKCKCGNLKLHCIDEPIDAKTLYRNVVQMARIDSSEDEVFFLRSKIRIEIVVDAELIQSDCHEMNHVYICKKCEFKVAWTLEAFPEVIAITKPAFDQNDCPILYRKAEH